ncbi:MAG: ribosome biogenesis GTPase Der [Candidatus Competibacteraceae bacterium]|jgi:GTP-binding protein|nr:ribosome biogenesis GTPase Der [Candidatus Competibacteraceae bacterium]
MLPVIALLGRPNVGKSTLFNCLTRTRDALVADMPGLTRDRQYGFGKVGPRPYLVVDTGGLGMDTDSLAGLVTQQAQQAAREADLLLLLVDGREGLSSADEHITQTLRRLGKPLYVVVNKAERLDALAVSSEFHNLGLGEPYTISAAHRQGLNELMDSILAQLPSAEEEPVIEQAEGIRLAVVGRPNVGKSTLINRLLGEERVVTSDVPGTTRDSIEIPFAKDDQVYTLIDTAGVRRRSRVQETVEKFSVIKTLQSIEQAHVIVMMLDAHQGIVDQDATLLGLALDSGRALVVAVNKWDHLDAETRRKVKDGLERKLSFLEFAEIHFISALHGSGIMDVLTSVETAYSAATCKLSTPELTRILEQMVTNHQPPLVKGHRIKLRYAHQGGQSPPVIVIHGNRVEHVPESYRRYLANSFRKTLNLWGTPVRIELRGGDNPYEPKKPYRPQNHRPVKSNVRKKTASGSNSRKR